MSVLSDKQIIDGLISGQIICRPLRPENIRSSSIDLTLGEWFWRCDARPGGVFNPYDEAEVKRYFDGPFQAKPYRSVYDKIGWRESGWPLPFNYPMGDDGGMTGYNATHPFEGIPEDWPVIVLRPRERILAHSHEFVGIKAPKKAGWDGGAWIGAKVGGTSMLKARSSTGRVGLKVCDDAGWGDIGYFSRWTWELSNSNDEAIILPVGERFAQIVFFETGLSLTSYSDEGKYQTKSDVEDVINSWVPEMMLPKSYKDERMSLLDMSAEEYKKQLSILKANR